jgi:type IV secretory pathway TraG/TraD family ATPase VirD4
MYLQLSKSGLPQLEALYGKYYAGTILNNCTQVFFRQKNLETAEYVSRLLGGKSAFSSSPTTHGDQTSEGKQEQKVPLMTPQDIRGMGDTILIFHPDLRYAIKAKRMPEFVKPEKGTMISNPQLPVLPEIPLLPSPRVDTWRRASEAYPVLFAEGGDAQ